MSQKHSGKLQKAMRDWKDRLSRSVQSAKHELSQPGPNLCDDNKSKANRFDTNTGKIVGHCKGSNNDVSGSSRQKKFSVDKLEQSESSDMESLLATNSLLHSSNVSSSGSYTNSKLSSNSSNVSATGSYINSCQSSDTDYENASSSAFSANDPLTLCQGCSPSPFGSQKCSDVTENEQQPHVSIETKTPHKPKDGESNEDANHHVVALLSPNMAMVQTVIGFFIMRHQPSGAVRKATSIHNVYSYSVRLSTNDTVEVLALEDVEVVVKLSAHQHVDVVIFCCESGNDVQFKQIVKNFIKPAITYLHEVPRVLCSVRIKPVREFSPSTSNSLLVPLTQRGRRFYYTDAKATFVDLICEQESVDMLFVDALLLSTKRRWERTNEHRVHSFVDESN